MPDVDIDNVIISNPVCAALASVPTGSNILRNNPTARVDSIVLISPND